MAWKGRQLTGYAKNGTMSTFTYDADGLRGSKTVGGVKTVYQYVGDKLYYEKRGDSQEFYYFYDSYGNLSSIYYTFSTDDYTSSAIYRTLTNVQGDVVAIYNNSGALVARYEYDAWGNVLSVTDANGNAITQWYHIANANPIRYRGYYYDSDLSLYYLQSRYYDSETGRFINADSILSQDSVLGYNMFAYCLNNPVTMADTTGELPFFLVTAAIGAVAGAIIGGVVAAKNGGNVWAGIGIGAAAGGLAGAGLGAAAGAMLAGSATASTAAVMMGAATLNATVATGGLGAGVAYIANNILGNPTYTDPVLYSGGDSALKAAQNYSATSGGTVIGDTIIGKTADCLSSRIPWLDNFIWKGASELFCHQATGSAHAFVCNSMFNASTSIFWNYEMPVLQSKAGYISEIIIEVFEGSI